MLFLSSLCAPSVALAAPGDGPTVAASALPDAPATGLNVLESNASGWSDRSTTEAASAPIQQMRAVAPYTPVEHPAVTFPRKLGYTLGSSVSARVFIDTALITGYPNLPSAPPSQPQSPAELTPETALAYDAAMQAYDASINAWRRATEEELRYRGRRASVGFATAESRVFLSDLIFPALLRQDPRYETADLRQSFGARMGHAFGSILVTRSDGGRMVPNISKIGGTVGAAYLGKEVYASMFNAPQLATTDFVLRYVGWSLAGDLATNVSREVFRSATSRDILYGQSMGAATETSYYPMTTAGKFVYWARSARAPRNFIQATLIAGLPTLQDQPRYPSQPVINSEQDFLDYEQQLIQYGSAVQMWRQQFEESARFHGRRFGAGFAESETQLFLTNFALPSLMRMDPRYIPLGPAHSGSARLGHALAGIVIGHTDKGERIINAPLILGTTVSACIAESLYYPAFDTPQLSNASAKIIGFNFAADALFNILAEFFPHRNF